MARIARHGSVLPETPVETSLACPKRYSTTKIEPEWENTAVNHNRRRVSSPPLRLGIVDP